MPRSAETTDWSVDIKAIEGWLTRISWPHPHYKFRISIIVHVLKNITINSVIQLTNKYHEHRT